MLKIPEILKDNKYIEKMELIVKKNYWKGKSNLSFKIKCMGEIILLWIVYIFVVIY